VPGADADTDAEVVSFCSTPVPPASELSLVEPSDEDAESGDGSEALPIPTIFLRREELEASLPLPPVAGLEVAKNRPGRCEKYEYALIRVDVLKTADTRNGASI